MVAFHLVSVPKPCTQKRQAQVVLIRFLFSLAFASMRYKQGLKVQKDQTIGQGATLKDTHSIHRTSF